MRSSILTAESLSLTRIYVHSLVTLLDTPIQSLVNSESTTATKYIFGFVFLWPKLKFTEIQTKHKNGHLITLDLDYFEHGMVVRVRLYI